MIYVVSNQRSVFEYKVCKFITIEESLKLLKPLSIIGVDTETTGLDCHKDTLLSLQLGCRAYQIVIDCTTIDVTKYRDILQSDRELIFWNAKFDLKWLFRYNIIPRRVYDGYLAEKLMYLGYPPGYHSLSLNAACQNYLHLSLDKSVRGQIIWKGLMTPEVIEYAADDVKYLEKLKEAQQEELKKKDLLIAIQYENAFVLPLAYMEYCGVHIDQKKWRAKMEKDKAKMQNALDQMNKWFLKNEPKSPYIKINTQGDLWEGFDLTPKVTLNWNSAQQVAPLFKKYGIDTKVPDKEKGGFKDSVDAKVLKPQKDKCSLIPLYLEYKEAVKVTTTYGETFLNQINQETGRLYTNYQQVGADTTRLTSGGKDKNNKIEYINFLNLPADEETRACFVAEKLNRWISIDYSGQESALLASIANDPLMLKEINEGNGDIHSLVASLVFKKELKGIALKDIKNASKESAHNGGLNYRQIAKGYEFLVAYGGDANTIQSNYGKSKEEAEAIYNSYMDGLSGVKKYQDFRRQDVMDKGYILLNEKTGHKTFIYDYQELKATQTKFNKEYWDYYRQMRQTDPNCSTVQEVRSYFKRKSTIEKQSINYPIQGTGSLCLRVALINFFKYLRDNNLLFKVLICICPYDEINCEAPEDIAEEVANELYKCMINAGAYFCTRCKLDADISRLEDGTLPTYWIH